ncbi:MAG: hypothetical protein Pars2KO_28510 [Parasphingorhabdus sp.]
MHKWAKHFTCIAPDTPGFGQSTPLKDTPEIDAFADALIELLDALGIAKCAGYGFHSGGIILVTAVKRNPERFTTLAIGGYAIWSQDEMELFDQKYLPEFHPSSYGEHLTWLWNRILEQTWFFPWFATEDKFRLTVAHDDPDRVDAVIREMLDAGNAYQAGYGAVLRAPRDIPDIDADIPPCLISAYDGDPLQDHIDRLGDLPPTWLAQKVASPAEHQQVSLDHLVVANTPDIESLNETKNAGFIHVKTDEFDGLLHWKGDRGSDILRLNVPGKAWANIADDNILHIELPGHGLSDNWRHEPPTNWSGWQAVIDNCIMQFETKHIQFPEMPVGDPDKLYPDLIPDRFGHYLQTAWQIVRAQQMFEPWYMANKDHEIAIDQVHLEPTVLATKHRDLLNARCARQYHQALQSR